jgi:hypothetical protein
VVDALAVQAAFRFADGVAEPNSTISVATSPM